MRRFGDVKDRVVDFAARAFIGDGTSAGALSLVIRMSQIGTYFLPGMAAIFTTQQLL